MRLYTEEQLDKAMDFARGYHRMSDTQFIETLTPIELPSDEEVEKEAEKYPYGGRGGSKRKAFIEGAIWVINKIQETNNLPHNQPL